MERADAKVSVQAEEAVRRFHGLADHLTDDWDDPVMQSGKVRVIVNDEAPERARFVQLRSGGRNDLATRWISASVSSSKIRSSSRTRKLGGVWKIRKASTKARRTSGRVVSMVVFALVYSVSHTESYQG